jgi:hypothetical protein
LNDKRHRHVGFVVIRARAVYLLGLGTQFDRA